MATMNLPVARIEPVSDSYFGTTIVDPYRWMEDWQSDEAMGWLTTYATHTRAYLDALPHRAALLARIGALEDLVPLLLNGGTAGGRTFLLRRDPGQNLARLIVYLTDDAPARVLIDPAAYGSEIPIAIDWFYPSRDGHVLAYGLSSGGSENSTLYVLDVDTGETDDLAIPRTQACNVSWLDAHTSFVYTQFPQLPDDVLPTERYLDRQVFLHRLDAHTEADPVVFGRDMNHRVTMDRADWPSIITTPTSSWMVGCIAHGVQNELTLYVAPQVALMADPADIPWVKIVDVDDAVTGFDLHGETIYLKTHKDAPRSMVFAMSLRYPDSAHTRVFVPESHVVIEQIRVVGDYLLTRDLDGGIGRLRRIHRDNGVVEAVPLPFDGTLITVSSEPGTNHADLPLMSWTESLRVYRYDVATNTMQDTGQAPPAPIDFRDIETHEVFAQGSDGTPIPLSIIHRRGLQLDGSNPTLLEGYGSYGISMLPFFAPQMLAWYEQGGVYAIAHIRGGGEYGEVWHKAGYKLSKQTTIDDFIACAEYVIAKGYTRPERLGGMGTSAGGIPSGGALIQRPDLWAAMIIRVGITNALRFEQSENGPPNVAEFGSTSTEDGFRGLQIMDSYSKVQDGIAYPAVMLTTGLNDPRVVAWQATKMAARLLAATASDRPILLRAEVQGGHGFGSTREQENVELADQLAFLLNQFGW